MYYITGDTHGGFLRIHAFCERMETTKDDVMIILGDVGFNFYQDERDTQKKKHMSEVSITLFCIQGNHEIRPQHFPTYKETEFHGGKVLYEEDYPNILFAVDGEIYDFDGIRCMVVGGAYSVDKEYRILCGYGWWPDEQPSAATKQLVEEKLESIGYKIDVMLVSVKPNGGLPERV